MDGQKKKYQELQTLLTEARDDIIKLEEENTRLKDQVSQSWGFNQYSSQCPFLRHEIIPVSQAVAKWADAAESDLDCDFQVNSDLIGITEAIHIMEEDTMDADDSDTDTIVDDDNTQSDILLDDLDDDIADITADPS